MVVIKVTLKDGNPITHYNVSEYSISENILKIKSFIPPTIHYRIDNVESIGIIIDAPQRVKFMTAESS